MTPKQAALLTQEVRRIRILLEDSVDRVVAALSRVS